MIFQKGKYMMHIKQIPKTYFFRICVGWLLGMVLGILLAYGSNAVIAPMIRGDIFMPTVSVSGVLLSSIVPIIVSLVLIYFRKKTLLLILLFLKAFLYGYCLFLISVSLKGSFLSGCYLFSANCSSLLMLLLSMSFNRFRKTEFRAQCFVTVPVIVIICVCDYCFSMFFTTFS